MYFREVRISEKILILACFINNLNLLKLKKKSLDLPVAREKKGELRWLFKLYNME